MLIAMEDMAMVDMGATEDMVDMVATEDMVDTGVASGLPMRSPLQLLKLMPTPMLIASDMDMADTGATEDMVDMGATVDMVDTTVASGLPMQSPLQLLQLMLNLLLMLMPITMVVMVATEVMVDTMVDTVDMVMVDMATGDKQIHPISSLLIL